MSTRLKRLICWVLYHFLFVAAIVLMMSCSGRLPGVGHSNPAVTTVTEIQITPRPDSVKVFFYDCDMNEMPQSCSWEAVAGDDHDTTMITILCKKQVDIISLFVYYLTGPETKITKRVIRL